MLFIVKPVNVADYGLCGIMANLVLNFRNKDVENIYMEIWQNEFGLAPG